MKKILLTLVLLLCIGMVQAQNPFEKFGYTPKIGTLSKGKYIEHFDTDSIVQIGSVLFNPFTKKITGFAVQETVYSEATLQPEIVSRWLTPDPLADEREWVNPYNFVQNNPILRIDPLGLTDFTINKKTGEVTQVGETNDEPDRVLKTYSSGKKEGQVKYNKKGEAKVAFGGIEQGILSDGMNLKTNDNLISVGGEGQPTEHGVEAFALRLSDYVGTEIGGTYFSKDGANSSTHIGLGKYEGNSNRETTSNGSSALRGSVNSLAEFNRFSITGFFHTHPSGAGLKDSDRLVPSLRDRTTRDNGLKMNPNLLYFLITHPKYGEDFPKKIPYAKGYPASDRR